MTPIAQAQQYLTAHPADADAWLVYDYAGMNPTLDEVLGTHEDSFFTRPVFLLIPASGTPTLLVSAVDAGQVSSRSDITIETYRGRGDAHRILEALLHGFRHVAMEYSPHRELPRASRVDAGTVELVRALGVDVVSSADLLQYATQRWTPEGLASHRRAVDAVARIVHEAFTYIGEQRAEGLTEHGVAELIMQRLADAGLTTDHGPVVAVNGHASDPHFAPTPERSVGFAPGDTVLIDLWAREPGPDGIYADITWVAVVGDSVPPAYQQVFDVVTGARDAAAAFLAERIAGGQDVRGWEADRVAREHIESAGYGDAFFHRLGHSLGSQVHAGGVNLDSLETHDTRSFLPGLGFTIEPGVYLPAFGIRSKIDLYVGTDGLEITTPVQRDVVLID